MYINLSKVTIKLTHITKLYRLVKFVFLLNAYLINSLPNDNFLDWTKFKAFADDKSNVAKNLIFLFDRVENIVGKGENAGYQHFLLFSQCFQRPSFSRLRLFCEGLIICLRSLVKWVQAL